MTCLSISILLTNNIDTYNYVVAKINEKKMNIGLNILAIISPLI